jgi:hypothetical protein
MTSTRRIRLAPPRRTFEPPAPPAPPPDVVQRDDGLFGLGWHEDAPGPFPTMQFAAAVAARQGVAA